MQAQSYTRVTLALDIVRKLTSGPLAGYHELAVIKHQIDLADTITVEDADETRVQCSDPRVPCDQTNICWRAVDLVRKECGIDRHAAISIDKRIPVMGGLAGGSANAATTLVLLNSMWQLRLDRSALCVLGRELGMDVPYYFPGATALDAEATGDVSPIPTGLAFEFVLVVPRFGVSTRDAYAGLDYGTIGRSRRKTEAMVDALHAGDRHAVLAAAHNDFENSVFARHPALDRLRSRLAEAGCEAALMTGSGSTVVGIAADASGGQRVADLLARDPDVSEVICSRTLARERQTIDLG